MPATVAEMFNEKLAEGMSHEDAEEFLRLNHEWLFLAAWPYV
jgi:hypothetical protein